METPSTTTWLFSPSGETTSSPSSAAASTANARSARPVAGTAHQHAAKLHTAAESGPDDPRLVVQSTRTLARAGARAARAPALSGVESVILAFVIICTQCGQENPETNKFCGDVRRRWLWRVRVRWRRSAKSCTALFCDLVGFTAVSESADPEDVNLMLDRYAAMARDADRGPWRGGAEVHW